MTADLGVVNQEALKKLIVDTIKSAGISINIPFDKIKSYVEDAAKPILSKLDDKADGVLKKADSMATAITEVTVHKPHSTKSIKGLFHRDFKLIFNLSTARNPINNYPVGLWLWGDPGAGKTHIAEQMAEALGVAFYPVYGGPTMTETKLLGYRNAGSGTYVKGLTYDWFKTGGLLTIDEADLGESLACMNSLFANRVYRFPDGELLERHMDTYFVALANTDGMGAKKGFRRQVQDVAALDRFNSWQFHYDDKLEQALSGNFIEFAEYVKKVRMWTQSQAKETNLHVTPRATMRGVALLASTELDGESICEASIFGRFPKDTKDACIKACGMFNRKEKV